MIVLSCNNLNKSFGIDSILENVNFTVNEYELELMVREKLLYLK